MNTYYVIQVIERLGLSFKNSHELNNIIGNSLSRHPQFERYEILVGGEVCEVFLRDVLVCVHALFSDPEFAPYLVLMPEKHFMDSTMNLRMYHDMHTGRWWWVMQ